MSALIVVRGFRNRLDPLRKKRYAIILGIVNDRIAIAPCTTYPARKGIVPIGSALLTRDSPAYAGTGFTSNQIAISIRDVGLYSFKSSYLEKAIEVGELDITKDKRFASNLKFLLTEYDLLHRWDQ